MENCTLIKKKVCVLHLLSQDRKWATGKKDTRLERGKKKKKKIEVALAKNL